ncbi:MAG: CDC27 family protein [Campylobacterales bacterium]|nr:CDC27 family protein [Campylobacterales bacterium]
MFDINELERKWLTYKIKFYLPHAVITVSIIVIFIILLTTINYQNSKNTFQDINRTAVAKDENNSKAKTETITAKIVDSNAQNNLSENKPKKIETKIVITPSLRFMDKINKSTLPEPIRIIEAEAPAVEIIKEEERVIAKEEVITLEEPKSTINIKRQNIQNDIEQVIKRFKKSNDPSLSLFIAKSYYNSGDYNLAYNYALITNEIDNNQEASWIIFAKSLVKLDQKDKAVETLKEYIKHSHSANAKTLMDEIVSGEMK